MPKTAIIGNTNMYAQSYILYKFTLNAMKKNENVIK